MTTLNSHPAKEGAWLVKPRLIKPERHRDSENMGGRPVTQHYSSNSEL